MQWETGGQDRRRGTRKIANFESVGKEHMEIHYSRSFLKYIHSIYIYIYKMCKWSCPIQGDNVSLDVIG